MTTLYRPELLFANGAFLRNAGLLLDDKGQVLAITAGDTPSDTVVELPGKALLPGFVNVHSHAFQRLIRGKSESRAVSGKDFWSWRGTMYHAAAQLDPQQVYDVARMAFLEMVLSGTTTVGEFHYLHTAPNGRPYDDPNLLSKQVIAAAQSVGIRIVLLRSAYLRSGFELPRDPGQTRFFETTPEFLANMDALARDYPARSADVRLGVAPHSIRAVPLDDVREIAAWARNRKLPLHMHMAEQVAENEACLREYGATPVALLGKAKSAGVRLDRGPRHPHHRRRNRHAGGCRRHDLLLPDHGAQPGRRHPRGRPRDEGRGSRGARVRQPGANRSAGRRARAGLPPASDASTARHSRSDRWAGVGGAPLRLRDGQRSPRAGCALGNFGCRFLRRLLHHRSS